MFLSNEISKRFKLVSALSMLGILFIHSKFILSRWGETFGSSFYSYVSVSVQYLISEQVTRICVPLFFMISGYFFYYKFNGTLKSYYTQLQKRFKSILIPYFLWSITWVILYNITKLKLINFSDLLNSLINPIPYQFWFLQVLIFCFIFSPVFFFLLKKLPKITILILLIFYLTDINSFKYELYGFGFFYLGGYLRYNKIKLNKKLVIYLFSIYILTIILGLILFILQKNDLVNIRVILHKISILSGIVLVNYYIFKGIRKDNLFENSSLTMDNGFFFFLFAAHEPLLSFLKKIWLQLFLSTYNLFAYFFLPTVLFILIKWFYVFLENKMPRIKHFYTGYR